MALWLMLFLVLLSISLLVVHSEPTSKVTWEDRRGFPVAFLQINRYTGPCGEENCTRSRIINFNPGAFALDLLILCAAAGIQAIAITSRHGSIPLKGMVTHKK